MGEAPEHIVLVETEADVDALEVADPERIAYISQTTLSVDETRAIINRLREKFPAITGPRTDDICYATTNRQAAVKQMAAECDLVLVIGSQNSSNSQRLVDVARDYGAEAHLIDNEAPGARRVARGQARGRHHLRRERARGARRSASSPSSAPAAREDVSEFEVMREDVRFMLPKTVRQAIAAREASSTQRRRNQARISSPCSSSARRAAAAACRPAARASGTPSASRIGCEAELLGQRVGLGDVVDRPDRDVGGAQQLDPVRGRLRAEHGLERARRARRCCATRALLVAKRSSAGRSGSPTASHRRANSRSLPTATANGRSAAS